MGIPLSKFYQQKNVFDETFNPDRNVSDIVDNQLK